jgi:ADP-ribosyl-[dinitrogen reductase] hydrolase
MDAPAQPDSTPLRNSYWVVPGKVLAGEHPGGTTVEATRERLQRLIAAGVECVMDLTEPSELKPYDPELPISIEYLRKPIGDHAIPARRGHMVEILDCIQDAVESGRCVYIHCRAGIGRTGTVVGCLLVERGLPGEAALDELNRLWQQSERSQNWGSVPETDAQVDFVRTWKPQLGLGTGGAAPAVRAAIFPKSLPPLDASTDDDADDKSDDKFPFAGLLVADKPTDGLPGRGAPGARGGAPTRDVPGVGGRGAAQPATDRPVGGASRPVGTPGRGVRSGDLPASDPSVWALRTGGSPGPGSATPVRDVPVSGAPGTGTPGRDAPAITTLRTGSPPSTSRSTRDARRPPDVAPPAVPVDDPLLDPEVLSAAGTLRDRFLGALLGLAVGDAVAAATQFRRPGTFTAVGDMLGGGPFDLPRGAWSDDTSMALCLADSLLETNTFNARDQMERYRRWQQEGYLTATGQCVGITASTARAIAMAQWRRQAFSGSHDPSQVDPEPLSRVVAPVLFFFASSGQATDQATEAARTTCQAPVVLDACRSLASALHAALSGQPKAVVLERVATAATGGRGAPAALTAAAAAFGATANFRDAVLYAANLGGDSDVVTAVCGQLAGAHYGVKAIPTSWHNGLMQKELIIGYADRLLAHAMLGLSG